MTKRVFEDAYNQALYDLGRDEQLEQCVEWLATLDDRYALASHRYIAKMMKDVMRPTARSVNVGLPKSSVLEES